MGDIYDELHDIHSKNEKLKQNGFCSYSKCKGFNTEFREVLIHKSHQYICQPCLDRELINNGVSQCSQCGELIDSYFLECVLGCLPLECSKCNIYICEECYQEDKLKMYYNLSSCDNFCETCLDKNIYIICSKCKIIVIDRDYLMKGDICIICADNLWRYELPCLSFLEDNDEIVEKLIQDDLCDF